MVLLLLACSRPVEAPADLDGLFHWFFTNYETASDEEMLAAAANIKPFILEEGEGTVTDLTAAERATSPVEGNLDPSLATGIYLQGPVACPFDKMEQVHYDLDQNGLYEEATGDPPYIEYKRTYTSDLGAYEARETPFLSWHTVYTVKPVTEEYEAEVSGSIRYVPAADGVGPVVVERAVVPTPALFEEGSNDYFNQDYQIDVMLGDGGGSVHGYAVWRDLSSLGLTDEDPAVQSLILNGLTDFDRDTEEVCKTY